MTFKLPSSLFWTVIIALLAARVALHDQIALGTSAGQMLAWLRTIVG